MLISHTQIFSKKLYNYLTTSYEELPLQQQMKYRLHVSDTPLNVCPLPVLLIQRGGTSFQDDMHSSPEKAQHTDFLYLQHSTRKYVLCVNNSSGVQYRTLFMA